MLQGRSSFNLEKIKSQDYRMISLHSSSSRIKPCRPDTLQPPAWRIADLPEVRTCIIFHVSSAVYLKEGSRWHLQYLTPLIWLTELQETSPSSLCCRCRSLKELYVLLLMSEILMFNEISSSNKLDIAIVTFTNILKCQSWHFGCCRVRSPSNPSKPG